MNICLFGSYDPLYPRNVLTKRALSELKHQLTECNDRNPGFNHYWNLVNNFIKNCQKSEVIYIGVLGHYDLPLAWILAKLFKKRIIFDAFYSLYDSYINDRKVVKKVSLQALRFYIYDWISVNLADQVILDTQENIKYYLAHYYVNPGKFCELPVTTDPDLFIFKPHPKHQILSIGFYGSFLPLHGVDIIIEALKLLPDINYKFYFLGDGPGIEDTKHKIKKSSLNKKVIFLKRVDYKLLPRFYSKIDLFLAGPFGKTDKARQVLPFKAVEALSVGIPTVIAETSATKRLLKGYRGEIIWVNSNALDLSQAIRAYNSDKKQQKQKNYFKNSPLSFENFKKSLGKIILK